MNVRRQLATYELHPKWIEHNATVAKLYEASVLTDNAVLAENGALATTSGTCTGRSPADKRIVENPESQHNVGWGSVNMPLRPLSYRMNRRRALDYLSLQETLYVVDGFVSWDPRYRVKVRLICARPYHALFLRNLLRLPTEEEFEEFGEPELVIFNAGSFPADPLTPDVTSDVSVNLNLEAKEIVILGTEYAGEMKKAIFSYMHYVLPERDVLSLHAAANEGPQGDVSLFLGLSGTGKTALSADPARQLIGDDEHGWSNEGIFNLEGGCYAKCIDLTREREPLIHDAIRYGCVLENTVLNMSTREVDFADTNLTVNTRAAYPLSHVAKSKFPAIGDHPSNVMMLTCDAFGVLPPVSQLSREQAIYHFLNGYTAKVSETEMGVTEPQATFSACYGAAFLTRRPAQYADLLLDRLNAHQPDVWLINTGWCSGDHRHGHRIELKTTRAIINAIHSGALRDMPMTADPVFGLQVPNSCPGVSQEILQPQCSWKNEAAYFEAAQKLKTQFRGNYDRMDMESARTNLSTSEYHRAVF